MQMLPVIYTLSQKPIQDVSYHNVGKTWTILVILGAVCSQET